MSIGLEPRPRPASRRRVVEHVVLVDERGRPTGTVPKVAAHHDRTPLHLAFSCYVVRADGAVLLTRRAPTKVTWPGVWSNACCGHPQLGETLRGAVTRRLAEELELRPERLEVAVGDFAYRAVMPDGTAEHELCPVLVALVSSEPVLDPSEADDFCWISWPELVERATSHPRTLSPWCVEQVAHLGGGRSPAHWLDGAADQGAALLDLPITLPDTALRTRAERAGVPASPPGPAGAGRSDDVGAGVRSLLDGFLDERRQDLVALDPSLGAVVDQIRLLVDAGGKRLRPAFTYWGHRATGAPAGPAVLRPAAAVEMLHTFALIHDDVMDRSTVRRGRPSAHAAFATDHRRRNRAGDADWHGVGAAVLTGDLAFVWADELFEGSTFDPEAMARARRVFTLLRTEVIAGQYLDLELTGAADAAEDEALHVALLKSARYTVTRPLLLGAALAPDAAGRRVEGALRAYGDAVGLAFQLRDDILGLFGDPAVTGKSCLDDLREGKRTVLVLRALRLATAAGRDLLVRSLGDPALDEAGAARCRDVVASSGALASVETLLALRHERATRAVARLDEPTRSALGELAALAIERQG